MNRKILTILALLIMVASITAVSAIDLGGLADSSESEKVTIDGIDFNIPAGFEEEPSLALNGTVNETMGIEYTMWGKTYTSNDEMISIGIASYDGVEVDDSIPEAVGGDSLSVNGVDGYEYDSEPFYGFVYAKDGKMAIITVTDSNLFKDIVIK